MLAICLMRISTGLAISCEISTYGPLIASAWPLSWSSVYPLNSALQPGLSEIEQAAASATYPVGHWPQIIEQFAAA